MELLPTPDGRPSILLVAHSQHLRTEFCEPINALVIRKLLQIVQHSGATILAKFRLAQTVRSVPPVSGLVCLQQSCASRGDEAVM